MMIMSIKYNNNTNNTDNDMALTLVNWLEKKISVAKLNDRRQN